MRKARHPSEALTLSIGVRKVHTYTIASENNSGRTGSIYLVRILQVRMDIRNYCLHT